MTRCVIEVNGRTCQAAPIRGRPYCWPHRHVFGGDATITLPELRRLAEDFDDMGGDLFKASEFVAWVTLDIGDRGSEHG